MRGRIRRIGVGLSVAALIGCQTPIQEPSIEGAWRVSSARQIDGAGNSTPIGVGAGLILFTKRHYSIAWMSNAADDIHSLSKSPTTDVEAAASRWAISDTERIQRFNSVVVNSGTFEVRGRALITRPVVALVSDFIGGTGTHEFNLNGNTLLLTTRNLQAHDGTQHPSYGGGAIFELTLLRVE